ncbi:hypothetical protein MSG28_005792 [Choristoneura fumiferana]|uniref:Uncharacterized protein n=1 Tax=Choristoneura fumiferana TaxID=7141 RepID=A0ACC0L0Q7_CHOFU|nr:hypothetical protein MSG28_005792 [Choristoneura fumiferana]
MSGLRRIRPDGLVSPTLITSHRRHAYGGSLPIEEIAKVAMSLSLAVPFLLSKHTTRDIVGPASIAQRGTFVQRPNPLQKPEKRMHLKTNEEQAKAHAADSVAKEQYNIVVRLIKLNSCWCFRRSTKIRLVRALVFPIFLYAAETWTLREVERRKIDALEMWCWRRMLGVSWTEFRTNESILQELGIKQRLSSMVQSRILTFFGHICRKEDAAMERLVIQGKVEGTRPRGRSPMRWTDQVKAAIEGPLHASIRKAAVREEWRRIVKLATST